MKNKIKDYFKKRLIVRDRLSFLKRNKNRNFTNKTIIANDCLPGFCYYLANMEFISPTINLSMTFDDLCTFTNNLKEFYDEGYFKQIATSKNVSFPVADLLTSAHKIRIRFVHYNNYDYATNKFIQRMKRIDFDNIIILLSFDNINDDIIKKADSIPYKKVILCNKEVDGRNDIICLKALQNHKKLFERRGGLVNSI